MTQLSIDSFEHDKLGLQPFAERLEKFLMVERDFVESMCPSCSSRKGTR